MAHLVLIRHGKSEWNVLGLWTGWRDIPLSEVGREEARTAAKELVDFNFYRAHSSPLIRAKETLDIILETLGITVPVSVDAALSERNYGVFTEKNKWKIKEEIGDAAFEQLRRGWDYPTPEGETLENVHARIVPYYEAEIRPDLLAGKDVLVVSHNNSLRALVKHLEQLTIEQLASFEIGTAEIHVYTFDSQGHVTHKEIRAENSEKGTV